MTSAPPSEASQAIVYSLAAAFGDARSACFAARSSGLNRSDDGAASWHNAFDSLGVGAPLPATSVALSPHFARDGTVFVGVPGGIMRSLDGGVTWSSALLPAPPPFVTALAVSPNFASDASAFAATLEDGVFVTGDGGASWAAWNIGLIDSSVLCVAPSPAFARDTTLFVGSESGLCFSKNGGRFWRETARAGDYAPVLCLELSPAFAHDDTIVVGTAEHGLRFSHDCGQSWQPAGGEAASGAISAVLLSPLFPATPHLLVLRDDDLLVSRDGGQSWAACAPPSRGAAAITAVAAPLGLDQGAPLLVGFDDGRVARYDIGPH